jgi:hypothetical protein
MPVKPKPKQKATVKRVMHAFKEGDLRSSAGTPVKNRKQAIAIALSESGQSLPAPKTQRRPKPKGQMGAGSKS